MFSAGGAGASPSLCRGETCRWPCPHLAASDQVNSGPDLEGDESRLHGAHRQSPSLTAAGGASCVDRQLAWGRGHLRWRLRCALAPFLISKGPSLVL